MLIFFFSFAKRSTTDKNNTRKSHNSKTKKHTFMPKGHIAHEGINQRMTKQQPPGTSPRQSKKGNV
jgi:hypothetical protein